MTSPYSKQREEQIIAGEREGGQRKREQRGCSISVPLTSRLKHLSHPFELIWVVCGSLLMHCIGRPDHLFRENGLLTYHFNYTVRCRQNIIALAISCQTNPDSDDHPTHDRLQRHNYRLAGKGALEQLDVLYHSAIRFSTNAPYRTHHCTLYSSVNWASLYTRHKTHWLMLIYKTLLGLTPPYLRYLLQPSSSTYNTVLPVTFC